jgi:hypothetical protein
MCREPNRREYVDSGRIENSMRKDWVRMAEKENGHIVETAREARGAEPGPTVRNVLVWSVALVVVAFVIVYLLFFRS